MGKIKTGILGGFQGKVGTVIGSTWRGENIMKALPKSSGKAPSEMQKMQRLKFKTISEFLNPLRSTLSNYYGNGAGVKSRYDLAVSYHLQNAIEVAEDTTTILFNRVMVAKGSLFGFQNASQTVGTGGVIDLTWEDNTSFGNAQASDSVSVVCYSEAFGLFYVFENIGTRDSLSAQVSLPAQLLGTEVQLYAFLYNASTKTASNSAYLGNATLV